MTKMDMDLLAELRRNVELRKHFLPYPKGLRLINNDIDRGAKALISGNKYDMESALLRLRGNRHWDGSISRPNVKAQPPSEAGSDAAPC